MHELDFLNNSGDREEITKTCNYLERASHKLQLMSVRKNMTVTEMQAQISIIEKWLAVLEKHIKGKSPKVAKRG